jgi:hypothetical protein
LRGILLAHGLDEKIFNRVVAATGTVIALGLFAVRIAPA